MSKEMTIPLNEPKENDSLDEAKADEEEKKQSADEIVDEEDEANEENVTNEHQADEVADADEDEHEEVDENIPVATKGSEVDDDDDDGSPKAKLPSRPIKKARTAYFIFADAKRSEIQQSIPGEGVAAIARVTGQLWTNLDDAGKSEYHALAAQERERVSQEIAKYSLDSIDLVGLPPARDFNTLIFPLGRIRKITKLDPDVKGMSKEALLLISKCAELATSKLGIESVKVAQLQNRRKLLPEDVAQVCATREQFLFLREDVKDLMKEQHVDNKKAADEKKAEGPTTASTSKPLTDYFGSIAKR